MTDSNLAAHNAILASARHMTGTIEENKKRAREAALSMGFDLPKRCEVLLPGQHEGKTPLERWLSSEGPRLMDLAFFGFKKGD